MKIPIQTEGSITRVRVRTRKKKKLSDLYPQRAILEELRRDGTLVHANDWIDHNYYEDLVETIPEINQRLINKYGKPYKENKPIEDDLINKTVVIDDTIALIKRIEINS